METKDLLRRHSDNCEKELCVLNLHLLGSSVFMSDSAAGTFSLHPHVPSSSGLNPTVAVWLGLSAFPDGSATFFLWRCPSWRLP